MKNNGRLVWYCKVVHIVKQLLFYVRVLIMQMQKGFGFERLYCGSSNLLSFNIRLVEKMPHCLYIASTVKNRVKQTGTNGNLKNKAFIRQVAVV